MSIKGVVFCPHCNNRTGWRKETPVRGIELCEYDETGKVITRKKIEICCRFKTRYFCQICGADITKKVEKVIKDEESEL